MKENMKQAKGRRRQGKGTCLCGYERKVEEREERSEGKGRQTPNREVSMQKGRPRKGNMGPLAMFQY